MKCFKSNVRYRLTNCLWRDWKVRICIVGIVGKSLKKVFIEIMRLVCVEVSY